MTDTAGNLVTKQGKIRRLLSAIYTWAEALENSGFGYALDRIDRLERKVAELSEELRESHKNSFRDSPPR